MAAFRVCARIGKVLAGVSIVGALFPLRAHGQSLTQGSLRGTVVLSDRLPLADASLTIEDEGGAAVRRMRTDADGRFNIALLSPGSYAILVEKSGIQPLRQRGVLVRADQRTDVRVSVTRRPPPITRVEVLEVANQRFTPGTPRVTEVLGGEEFVRDGARLDLAESGRFATGIVTPMSVRWGLADVMGSLPQSQGRLLIDGLPVTWTRHPGLETEPAAGPLVPPFLQREARLLANQSDAEPSGAPAGMLGVISRPTTRSLHIESFANFGTGAGLSADSSLQALQAGAVISGTAVKDKAQFIAGGAVEKLDLPSPRPWTRDSSVFNGADVLMVPAIVGIARDSFNPPDGVDVGRYTRPTLRTYRGGVGLLGVDWQLSGVHQVSLRAFAARHREGSPEFGRDVLNGSGGRLESRDFLGSATITSTGPKISNEFRIGIQSARRDWSAINQPTTYLVSEGAGVGSVPAWPGRFKWSGFEAVESFQYQFGDAGAHRMKFGVSYVDGTWDHDYAYGSQGIFQFGSLDDFANGVGSYYGVTATRTDVSFGVREIGIFGHLDYRVTPSLSILTGIRWDRNRLPNDKLVFDSVFATSFGLRSERVPNDNVNLAPRLGLLWTGDRAGGWLVSLVGSIQHGGVNPGRFAEVMLGNDTLFRAQRAVGTFATWPTLDPSVTPIEGRRVALFSPSKQYRDPRAAKLDLEIRREVADGFSLRLTGRYHHTDFLLRRSDLNLLSTPTGVTAEGGAGSRPIYGTLVQSGAMVVAVPGSNRQLLAFDLVSAFSSTAAQDFSEVSVGVDRVFMRSLAVSAVYAISRTRDNWPQSWTGDPVEELSPFPEEPIGRGWAKGVSDFDVPHRAIVTASWQSRGKYHVRVQGRYRYHSGLPYTPGFQPGVDANADGSGRNDPAFVDANIPGMPARVLQNDCLADQVGLFARRNSCREDGRHGLDLGGSVAMRLRSLGGRVEVTLDILNLIASRSGVVDHALVLVDPQNPLVTDPQGNVTLSLLANPRFGKLLSRREEPRVVRLGLRFGNW